MASDTQRFIGQKFYYSEKEIEKASDIDIRRGQRVPQTQQEIYIHSQKNVSRLLRSYQTHSQNLHIKIRGLVRRCLLRRRNILEQDTLLLQNHQYRAKGRFTEHGPAFRPRHSFPLNQSLPSGSFYKPVILIHQRADRVKITITEN